MNGNPSWRFWKMVYNDICFRVLVGLKGERGLKKMLSEYVRVRLIEEMKSRNFMKYTEFARSLNLDEQWVRSKLIDPGREGSREISLDDLAVFADKLSIPVCSLFPLEIYETIKKIPIGEFLFSICKAEIEERVRVEIDKYLKGHPITKEDA